MATSDKIIFYYHGPFDLSCLRLVADHVSTIFSCKVVIIQLQLNLEDYYNIERRQYNANDLLKKIDTLDEKQPVKKIGLFQVDLFIPILTFIFGQAVYQGNSGLVSTHRLKKELYGLESDLILLRTRLLKVIMHELGHMHGLKHCHFPNCVMRSSTYVEDLDQKKPSFCINCQKELAITAD